jgi:signal transduction histidine kinase/ligand-binding sensor domain-containing protein
VFAAAATLMAPCAVAEPVPLRDAHLRKVWETDDGLPHNAVISVLQRRDGFLWVTTEGGTVRFDGLSFAPFRVPPVSGVRASNIRTVIEEDDETLLLMCDRPGLIRFRDKTFLVHPAVERFPEKQKVQSLFREEDGVFWIVFSDLEAWRWRHGFIEKFPVSSMKPFRSAVSFARDQQSNVYVARGLGVELYQSGNLISLASIPIRPTMICASQTGGLWLATAEALSKFEDGKITMEVTPPPWPEKSMPSTLLEGRDGVLWIGTSGHGLLRWTPDGCTTVETSHPRINRVSEDDEGNLWVATAGGGLNRLQTARFQLFAEDPTWSTDTAGGVCEDTAGHVWFANRRAVRRISANQIDVPSSWDGWPDYASIACADRAGNVWFAIGPELCRAKANSSEPPIWLTNDSDKPIYVFFVSRDGSLWAGRQGGPLERYRNDVLELFGPEQGYTGTVVQAINEDAEGHLWVGTRNGNLFQLVDGRFTKYSTANGLPKTSIRTIFRDAEGLLWIGTGGAGLLLRQNDRFARITELQGLVDDTISQVIEDDFGYLWLGARRGLSKVAKTEILEQIAGRRPSVTPITYGRSEGLPGFSAISGYQPSAWKTTGGQLWFVTRKGLVMTDPGRLQANPAGPRVHLEKFMADGQSIANPHVRLPSSTRRFEFHYTTPAFVAPEKVRFRYQLEGFDSGWTEAGPLRIATYSTLPPNHYRFRVTASNGDHVWSPVGATLSFDVLPAWWERWWAQVALLSLGGLILAACVRFWSHRLLKRRLERLEHKHRLESERARIARDLHDHLGSGLVQISMIAEELHEDCQELSDVKSQSARLVQRARSIARDLDAVVWAANPQHDSLPSLCSYLCQFSSEYFRCTPIRCRIDAEDKVPTLPLSPEARHHLFMAAKEAMNNVLKHSQATEVHLIMRICDDCFELIIADNGRGFCMVSAETSGRNGLPNMRFRIAEIGGNLDIQSSDAGTTVSIRLPLDDSRLANPPARHATN